jgi:hypothetical protein
VKKHVDNIPKLVYNKEHREEDKTNKRKALERRNGTLGKKKKHKKKPIKWQDLAVNALIDLIVGTVLIIIGKLLE